MAISDNILSNLDLATYRLTLYLVKPHVWNDPSVLIKDEGIVGSDAIIISESGTEAAFAMDNLTIESVISPSRKSSYTTTGLVQFDLTEPLGFSFLERLQVLAPKYKFTNIYGAKFVLKVQFIGRNVQSGLPEPQDDVYVYNLGLHSLNASLNEGGTTYNFICFNMFKQASIESVAETPVTVKNVKTVSDFTTNLVAALNENENRIRGNDASTSGISKKTYDIVFDESASISAKDGLYESFDLRTQNMGTQDSNAAKGTGENANSEDSGTRDYPLRSNSNIAAFIQNTINEEVKSLADYGVRTQETSNVLPVITVTPTITFTDEIDPVTNAPGHKVTFVIGVKWISSVITRNNASTQEFLRSEMKQSAFFDTVLSSSIVKKYEFLYTGNNTDILQFDLNYNALFRVSLDPSEAGVYPSTMQTRGSVVTGKQSQPVSNPKYLSQVQQEIINPLDEPIFEPTVQSPDRQSSSEHVNNSANTVKYNQYVDFAQRSDDFTYAEITIKGDPFWLGSPDAKVRNVPGSLQSFAGNNISIAILNNKPNDTFASAFENQAPEIEYSSSGVYDVQTVESRFQQGKFTQQLGLIKNMKVNPYLISTKLTEL